MRRWKTFLGLSVLVSMAALGGDPPAAPARIETLAWMAGAWQGSEGGTSMEEVWLAPAGGVMLGLHRDLRAGRLAGFEFLRIEETAQGLLYLAQPGGRPPTPFPSKEVGDKRVVFENPQHDFPQRIRYWLDEGGALCARVEGKEGGKEAPMQWRWTRAGR